MPLDHGFLDWVSSEGGPLLLIPREYLLNWRGVAVPAPQQKIEASFRWNGPDAPATDYDRACDIIEYLGLLEVAAGWGLVMSEGTIPTAWFATPELEGGIIVRGGYGEEEHDILETISTITEWPTPEFLVTVGGKLLYLFDAGCAGEDVENYDDHLKILLPKGKYEIITLLHRLDEYDSVILHRLRRAQS